MAPAPSPSPMNGRWEFVADKIEKELDGALPCGDDMVRAERLRGLRVNSYEITISS